MSAPQDRFTVLDWLVVVAINLCWGLNVVAMKLTVGATGPFTAGVVRWAAVGLICVPWWRIPVGRGRALALLAVVNGGLFMLFFNLAMKAATNVGALAIAGQLSAPIAILLGVLVLGETVSRQRIAGVALAFAGVAVMAFDPRIVGEALGLALMIAAATAWGVSSLLQRRLAGTPVLTMYFWSAVAGVTALLPMAVALEPAALARLGELRPATMGWFAFSVLGATLAGQGGLGWLLARHPVSRVMPLTLLAPVVSVISAHLLLGSPISPPMAIGGLVAIAGVAVITLSVRRDATPA